LVVRKITGKVNGHSSKSKAQNPDLEKEEVGLLLSKVFDMSCCIVCYFSVRRFVYIVNFYNCVHNSKGKQPGKVVYYHATEGWQQ